VSSLYSGIIPIIKRAAIDAVNSTQPVQFVFGTVTIVSPLKVQVTPKLTLGKGSLVVPESLSKYSVKATINGSTSTITINNSLEKGDSVVLARMQGGNKYLVLDKAVNA
jgi:hypothetical protein